LRGAATTRGCASGSSVTGRTGSIDAITFGFYGRIRRMLVVEMLLLTYPEYDI
jgi:hypothetical protein